MSEPDRAAFEAFARSVQMDTRTRIEWGYIDERTHYAWIAWQAAARAERQRCLAAVDEVCKAFGKTGEVVAAAIKAKIGEP